MTCSRKFDRLLRATSFGLVGILAAAGCGGSSSSTADSGTPNGPEGGPKTDGLPTDVAAPVLVTVSPPVLDFGSVDVGQTSSTPSSVTVTNLGPATSLTPTIVQPSPFALAANTCNTLAAAGTCIISVSFTPDHTGPAAGTLVVAGSVMVSLTGVGSPPADFTQTDHVDLGTILVGATVSGKVTVTATNPLTDLLCSVSSAGNIKADPTTTTCPTAAPGALAKSASCTDGFTFSSATAGGKTGDEVICNAGSVTKITSITAVVTSGAKLVISPAAPQTAANTGKTNTVTVTVANGGGSPTGGISAAITPANPEFSVSGTTCAVGLLPLGTCTVTVTFAPVTDGTKTAVLAVTDAGAPAGTLPTTVTITGVATGLSNLVITGGPDLGTVALGDVGIPVTFTVKNTGGTDATGVSVTSNNAAFVLGNDGCTGQTLAKTTGTCTVTLTFAPSATGLPGAYSGLLTATAAGTNPFNLPVTATATTPAILTIEPNPLAFNGIALNTQSAAGTLTITNTGGASTGAITVPAGLGNGFLLSGNTCSAPLLPTQTCTISITSTPGAITPSTWTFTVTSASGATATAQLTGTGKQPNVLELSPNDVKGCGELRALPSAPPSHSTVGLAQCFEDTAMGQADGSFPKTPVGTNAPVTFIIHNTNTATAQGVNLESGVVTVTIGGTNAADFVKVSTTCGPSLQPNQTCLYVVSFKPSAPGLRVATISVASANGGNAGTNMEGIGLPPISIQPCGYSATAARNPLYGTSPTNASCIKALADTTSILNKNDRTGLNFGQVSLGANCDPLNVKWFLVTINSSTAADNMNLITATLTDPQTPANFRISNASNTDECNNTNVDVSQGPATCWISVQFMPQGTAKEAKTAAVGAVGGSSGSASLNLTGASTGPLTITPSTANFGTVVVNEAESGTLTLTVANWSTTNPLGPVSVALSGAAPGDFRVVSDTCTDYTLKAQSNTACTYGGANTCEVGYRFVPKALGARAATITVTAGTETSTATLSGVGVQETTITAGPAAISFGGIVLTNKSAYQTITVTAGTGGVETGTLEFGLDGTGDDEEFQIAKLDTEAGSCGLTDTQRLGGNNPSSCTINVRFVPQAHGGLGLQKSTLLVSDPRDRTLAQKITLTGTGLTQLTITPTTGDFGIMAANHAVTTTLTFTVTNIGTSDINNATVVVDPLAVNSGGTGGCDPSKPIKGNNGTCLVVVNYNGTPTVPGVISGNPLVQVLGADYCADQTDANDSTAAALLTGTVQTNAHLELVGLGTTAYSPLIDLGDANSGTSGGEVTLLYRNSGGHDTSKISYYFSRGGAVGSSASWVREQINTPDTDFAVNLTNTDTTDNCVGNVVKGGQYCKVLLDFKPTHSQMELAAFEILADIGGTAQAVVVRGLGTDTTTDTITIQPGFVSLIGLPSSTGLTAGAPELTILPTANFTITNGSATSLTLSATNLSLSSSPAGISSNFAFVARPSNTTQTSCGAEGAGFTLPPSGSCGVWVAFLPVSGATPVFEPVSVVLTAGTTYTGGVMGKVRQGTVLKVWDPATGTDFGNVTRQLSSAPMLFTVMNIGDAPTFGNVTPSVVDSATGAAQGLFSASGCGASPGILAAFNPAAPSSAATCTAQVILSPGASAIGPVVSTGTGSVVLEADAVGTLFNGTKTPTSGNLSPAAQSSALTGTCINPAALAATPSSTASTPLTFTAAQAIGTASDEMVITISNGDTTTERQTTSGITFSLTDSTNFVLDLSPVVLCSTSTTQTCEEAKNQVTGALILMGGESCIVGVKFIPQAMPASGTTLATTMSATADTGGTASSFLQGTATYALSVTAYGSTPVTDPTTKVPFGSVSTTAAYVDQPQIAITITNAAGAPTSGLLSTSVTGSDFVVVVDTCQGITLPDNDPVMPRTCTVTVMFAPTATGTRTGTLTVSGTPGGTATIGLTGTGT